MNAGYWLETILSVVVCVVLGLVARRLINRGERR